MERPDRMPEEEPVEQVSGSEERDTRFDANHTAGRNATAVEHLSGRMDWQPVARVCGWLFVLLFLGLREAGSGFRIQNYPPFASASQGELMLWIGHCLLLVPGAVLLGLGYANRIAPVLRIFSCRLESMSRQQMSLVVGILFVAGAGAAWTGNRVVMRGFPVTDDEYAVKFGGQVLALGRLLVPEPPFVASVPDRFLFFRDGLMTSMDWLGPQVAWAAADISGSGNLVWAILASVALAAVAVAAGRRLGPRWGLVAAAFFGVSPMAVALSMSTHAHLASRAFFALAVVFLVDAIDGRKDTRAWTLFGLAAGTSFVCRPFETGFLCLPIGLDLLWRVGRRSPDSLRNVGLVLAGAALPLAVFAAHSWALTGSPLVPPRFDPMSAVAAELPALSTWGRFGNGVSFNALMLGVWFLGPLGVLLAVIGTLTDRITRLLALGVCSVLALGLFHDNFGIHSVGPIHYSECVVPLTLLATHGLHRIWQWTNEHRFDFGPIASVVALILVVALGAFNVFTFVGLRSHADIQAQIYGRIEAAVYEDASKAIVLAPTFDVIWKNDETFTATGSWVFVWRRPRPDFSDDVMILHDMEGQSERLRREFPDRRLYRLIPGKTGTDFAVVPVPADAQSTGS